MADFMTDDQYIKKKTKTADVMYSENVSYSEYNEGSAKKKKKKKNKHNSAEDETVIEVSSSDNLSPSYKHSSFAEHEEQEHPSEQEVSTEDYSNTWKSPKKSKKKKRRESSEEIKVETDHADQTSLYNEHTPADEAQLSQSVKKKKKKHRLPVLEEELSADVQQKSRLITLNENTDVESRPLKKKKMASPKKSSQDVDIETPSTFSDERGPKTDGCLSPKVRRSRKVSVAEDMPLNEKTDLENADVSGEKTCENVTETTGYETDDNMGNVTKTKKSAKRKKSKENHQDQDMTEELDNLNETTQMDITLDEETSDPKEKKSDSAKRRRSSASGRELLTTIREKDLALLEEYFPRIRSMSARTISELISCELKRVGEAKRKGIMFQTGRFDSTEDELIKKNVEEFMKLAGLESGEMLFYSYRFPDKKSTIESLKKKYHFRQRIAQGIARSVTEVNNRGSKLYDLSGNKGRYTKEEIEKLQQGVSEHGNDWITIGKSIGRNCKNVQLKASQLRRVVTGGRWHTEEVNRLIQAVKEFILSSMKSKKNKISSKEVQAVPKQMLFSGIPWAKIEEKVKTRNWTHCKSKWNDILLLRMNDGISPCEGVLGLQTTIEIINWLHAAELPKGQVNWLEMAKDIGNIPPGILQQKVYKLKSRHVPEWQDRSFKEIVDCLYEEVLPKVETSLQDSLTNLISVDGSYMMPEKKDTFLISDIFQEYIGDDRKSAFIDDSNSDDSS